jgi:hypothetical protein
MKKFEKRPRPTEASSTRTGPRARAAQERKFSDPYVRAERPSRGPRTGDFDRGEREGDRRPPGRPAVVTLDPDVSRVFRDSETVNEALRLVMRLARFGAPRPAFNRERPGPAFGGGRGASPRGERQQERRGPPRPRAPRFKSE